jgi:hypothetical protein
MTTKKPSAAAALLLAKQYDFFKASRLAKQKETDKLEEKEVHFKTALMDMLHALKVRSVGSKEKVYAIVPKIKPSVTDWTKLYAHIKRTGNFELLQRRVGEKAVAERWDLGKKVPGVEQFPVETLSVTKAKGA